MHNLLLGEEEKYLKYEVSLTIAQLRLSVPRRNRHIK